MARKIQRNVDGSLELRGLALYPSAGGPFDISPEIGRTIANLAALDGALTRLLACDASGRLSVDTDLLTTLGDPATDGGLWHTGHSAARSLYDIYTVLNDVWDPCTHSIRTTVLP